MEKKRIMVVITKDEERITKYFNSRILCDIWCIWKMITGWFDKFFEYIKDKDDRDKDKIHF